MYCTIAHSYYIAINFEFVSSLNISIEKRKFKFFIKKQNPKLKSIYFDEKYIIIFDLLCANIMLPNKRRRKFIYILKVQVVYI